VSESELDYDHRIALAGGELARLVLRLRSLSPLAWRTRRKAVLAALRSLAELSGRAEQRVVPAVPAIADYALADAVAVIGGDAIAALVAKPDEALLSELVATMREALALTR
jgi:hypothetical protein